MSAESHRLSVSLSPDAPQYRPGEPAILTIQVTDASGAPVEALIGLALVDEAIFALSEDLSADVFETFYGRRMDNVLTYDSLTPRRYYWSWLEDVPPGTPTPTPLPALTPTPAVPRAQDPGRSLRQEFRDTAYWNPDIRTGLDGRAVVTIPLPDNLTTWRAIARAVTRDTKVGDATTGILVTQEIIAWPALPRFTVLGDRFALDAIAQNFSGQDVTGTVSLDAPNLVVLDPGLRPVDLPNGWRDTQATAFAVLALTDTILVSGELEADYTYKVILNGAIIASGQVTPETVTEPIAPIVVGGADLRDGQNELRVERDGPGQLYYTLALRLELFYDGFEPVSSADQGLAVSRTYRLAAGGASHLFNTGDLVEVQLTVEARDELWYVVIEDRLPAGFEALNERINPVAYGDPFARPFWPEWGYNRKDVYDDRVVFFVTQLWPGRHQYTYLMRATTPGEFSALPAQAYPMYAGEIWGRSGSDQVKISPEGLAPRPALAGDFDRNCRVTGFDTRQAAAAWRTDSQARDLDGDGDVDIVDVATVAMRQGATCLADQPPPGAGEGHVALAVVPSVESVTVGRTFDVDVLLESAAGLGGFELELAFDPARLRVARITLGPGLDDALPLGPRVDNQAGSLTFGVLAVHSGAAHSRLVTITFMSQRTGHAGLEVHNVQAVDAAGRSLQASATVDDGITVENMIWYLPLVRR